MRRWALFTVLFASLFVSGCEPGIGSDVGIYKRIRAKVYFQDVVTGLCYAEYKDAGNYGVVIVQIPCDKIVNK